MAKGKKKKVIKKAVKTRFNEIGTGRIIWVAPDKVKEFRKQYDKDLAEFKKDKQRAEIENERKNFKAESYESLKENKALNFLGKEKKEKVLKIAKELDKNFVEYSLKDILKQDLNKEKIVFFDKTPSMYFYWNVQNKADRNEFGENVKFEIKDFSGVLVYSSFDSSGAINLMDVYNKIIQRAEKKYTDIHGVNAYPSVGVFEAEYKDKGGNLVTESVLIDYSIIQTKLPKDHESEFLKGIQ